MGKTQGGERELSDANPLARLKGGGQGVKGPQPTYRGVVLARNFGEGVAAADGVVGGTVAGSRIGVRGALLDSEAVGHGRHARHSPHDPFGAARLGARVYGAAQHQAALHGTGGKVEASQRSDADERLLSPGRNACVCQALGEGAIRIGKSGRRSGRGRARGSIVHGRAGRGRCGGTVGLYTRRGLVRRASSAQQAADQEAEKQRGGAGDGRNHGRAGA